MSARPQLRIVSDHPPEADQAVRDFLSAKSGKAPKTVRFYELTLRQFRAFAPAWPPAPAGINAYLNDCKARQLSESTIDSYYRALRIWLTWLHKLGYLADNPILLAERPPRPKPIPRAPRRNHLKKLFSHLEAVADNGRGHWLDVRSLALWSLALDTGCRVGEIAALTVSDITIKKKRRNAFIKGAKTHRDRIVVFHRITAKDLRNWLDVRAGLDLPPGLDNLFISGHRGEWRGLTESGMRQDLKERCLRLGLPHLTPHQFRNAYAVYSIRNRADLLDVQKQMGHESLSTTQRYTMVDDAGRARRHDKKSPRGKK